MIYLTQMCLAFVMGFGVATVIFSARIVSILTMHARKWKRLAAENHALQKRVDAELKSFEEWKRLHLQPIEVPDARA